MKANKLVKKEKKTTAKKHDEFKKAYEMGVRERIRLEKRAKKGPPKTFFGYHYGATEKRKNTALDRLDADHHHLQSLPIPDTTDDALQRSIAQQRRSLVHVKGDLQFQIQNGHHDFNIVPDYYNYVDRKRHLLESVRAAQKGKKSKYD